MGFDLTQIGYCSSSQTQQQTTFPSLPPVRCGENIQQLDNVPISKRIPNCQKCGQHGRKSRLKGHKRVCPYRDCNCAKCQVVSERQKLMADQIKIRRRQRKDTLLNITRENITATLNAAAAVAASGPLPYFHNFNALLYKQLQQNMRHPAVSFLPGQPPPTENILETGSFNNTSGTLSSYLAGSAAATSLKLGQSPQQRPSPSALPHLQFLFQPQVTTPTTTTTSTAAECDLPALSITPPCTQSDGSTNAIVPANPPIAVPVPINPITKCSIQNTATTATTTTSSSTTTTTTTTTTTATTQQQQQQRQQQTDLTTQVAVGQTLTNQIPAFLDNDHLFQTLLNNMRQLEWKIPMEATPTAIIPESGNKAETSHMSSIFVDVCSM
uniref:DM domain-containing protein n=1 Tax=Loa loa TaxID=7209 RepID=A0A1I7VDM6_LOALO